MHYFKQSFDSLLLYSNFFYNHILKSAGLEETLTDLNVKDDVKNFILSLPKKQIQYYIVELKKNPNLSLDELKTVVKLPKEKSESQYLAGEIKFVESMVGPISEQPGQ